MNTESGVSVYEINASTIITLTRPTVHEPRTLLRFIISGKNTIYHDTRGGTIIYSMAGIAVFSNAHDEGRAMVLLDCPYR